MKIYWKPEMENFETRSKGKKDMFLVPEEIYLNEDPRWLQIEAIADPITGELIDTITVNEALKVTIQISDSEADAEAAASKAHELLIDVKLLRLTFSNRFKAEVSVLNDSKSWTVDQTLVFMSDIRVLKIFDLINSGAIESARDTILITNLSAYYTEQEISDMVLILTNYLLNE